MSILNFNSFYFTNLLLPSGSVARGWSRLTLYQREVDPDIENATVTGRSCCSLPYENFLTILIIRLMRFLVIGASISDWSLWYSLGAACTMPLGRGCVTLVLFLLPEGGARHSDWLYVADSAGDVDGESS